jgi:hypothetical protein
MCQGSRLVNRVFDRQQMLEDFLVLGTSIVLDAERKAVVPLHCVSLR